MALVAVTGTVLYNGAPIGKKGELVARPNAEGEWVVAGDHIAHGSAKAETDAEGVLQGAGLEVEDVDGLLYTLTWQAYDGSLAYTLGTFDLSGGGDLATITTTDYTAITETLALDIAAAAALGATNDTATASFVNNPSSATRSALTRTGAVHNILTYTAGSIGGGTTNDTVALGAALAAAGAADTTPKTVYLPDLPGGYTSTPFTVPAGVTLRGENWVSLKARSGATAFITLMAGAKIENIKVDCASIGNTQGVAIASADCVVERCVVKDVTGLPGSVGGGIAILPGASNVLIRNNIVDGCQKGIHSGSSGAVKVRIEGNHVKNWVSSGIRFLETGTGAASDIWVVNNLVTDCVHPAVAIQADVSGPTPIVFNNSSTTVTPYQSVNVIGNTVEGRDTSNENLAAPGTADQFTLNYCHGFNVSSNISRNGGEAGISVTQGCVGGTVSGNTVIRSDGTGIHIWGKGIAVTGNTVVDSAMNRSGLKTSSAYNGYSVSGGMEVVFTGNTLRKTATAAAAVANYAALPTADATNADKGIVTTDTGHMWISTPSYATVPAYSWRDYGPGGQSKLITSLYASPAVGDSVGVRLGTNNFPLDLKIVNLNGAIVEFPPIPPAWRTSDLTRNNQAALDDPQLTQTVAASATYLVESLLIYSGDTSGAAGADFHLEWTLPTGSTFNWVSDAPASNATSPLTLTSRAGLVASNNFVAGGVGVGTKVVAKPVGYLKTAGTAGSLTVKWGQEVPTATNTVLYEGSYLKITRVL